jgi:colicin import membrane protein
VSTTIGQFYQNEVKEAQRIMAKVKAAEVEELEDLEDLVDEADEEIEDAEVEEEADEDEAPRRKKKTTTTKKAKASEDGVGSAELAEALETNGRNLRVMLRDKKVKKDENNRYHWNSVEEALTALGFDDVEEAQAALKASRNKRLEALKEKGAEERAKKKAAKEAAEKKEAAKKPKPKPKAEEPEDDEDDDDE